MMYGWSGWGMWLIGPIMLVAIIWLLVWLVRDSRGATGQGMSPTGPRATLDERFARGEIERDDYLERVATLEKR